MPTPYFFKTFFLKTIKNPIFWLLIIIIIGFWARLYKINNPIADWHSWRQADTAAVARNFYQEGYNPFIPKYDDMSGVAENPVPNPGRYRFVEFPIYNSLVYFSYLINGSVNEKYARIVSILFSLGSIIFIYLITKKYFDKATAVIAALIFSLLPFNVYFSRVILPEPSLVFFCLGMFFFTDLWINKNSKKLFLLSLFFTICAFLTKPTAIFYLLPLIYVYRQKEGKFFPIKKRYLIWVFLSLIPFAAWRFWIGFHPEGIPASNWLFNGTHIRFRPAFFKWIVGDRFGREILTVTGTFLFLLGLILKPNGKESILLHLLAFSSLLFLVVFATGNVQHDYYQTLIIPALTIFTARGFTKLFQGFPGSIPRLFTMPLAVLLLVLTFYLGWGEVKGLYQINNPVIVEAGQRADQIIPKDAVVVAPYNGDTAFLYQVNRPGWAVLAYPVEDLIKNYNVSYYISTTKDSATNEIIENYTVLEDNGKYVIIDLTKEK